jgi:hypothetical protein
MLGRIAVEKASQAGLAREAEMGREKLLVMESGR